LSSQVGARSTSNSASTGPTSSDDSASTSSSMNSTSRAEYAGWPYWQMLYSKPSEAEG
jgi:hypothetical protein